MKILKKIKYNSPVILTFALCSLLILGISFITKGESNRVCFSIYRSSPKSLLFYVRLFGHVLGHANLEHFASNFIMILLIGPILEERYGSKTILLIIATTSIITGLVSLIVLPNSALLGASGVAFMLILLSSFSSTQDGAIPLTLILTVIIYLGREIIQGASNLLGASSDNISQLAHITGGVCGIIYGIILKKNKGATAEQKTI